MSLAGRLSAAIGTAFAAAGDLIQTATYQRRTTGTYDATTGTVASTITEYTCEVAEDRYSAIEIDGDQVKRGDLKLIVRPEEVGNIQPHTDDRIVYRGKTWEIVGFDNIINEAFVIQCRSMNL